MADRVGIDTNASLIAASIDRYGFEMGAKIVGVVHHHGQLLQSSVKRHSAEPRTAERPGGPNEGPRLLTGDYNRSHYLHMHGTFAEVGTNKPQGRRLEHGFVGEDSLGRVYDQQPYRHYEPAWNETIPLFMVTLAAVITDGWDDGGDLWP